MAKLKTMKNIILAFLCILVSGTISAQIGKVEKTTDTNYKIYDESGKSIGSVSSWSNCNMVGYTSKYIVIDCDTYATYVYDHKGNIVASKSSNTGCLKCSVFSVTPSGITFKKENGDKVLYDFKLNPD